MKKDSSCGEDSDEQICFNVVAENRYLWNCDVDIEQIFAKADVNRHKEGLKS